LTLGFKYAIHKRIFTEIFSPGNEATDDRGNSIVQKKEVLPKGIIGPEVTEGEGLKNNSLNVSNLKEHNE